MLMSNVYVVGYTSSGVGVGEFMPSILEGFYSVIESILQRRSLSS